MYILRGVNLERGVYLQEMRLEVHTHSCGCCLAAGSWDMRCNFLPDCRCQRRQLAEPPTNCWSVCDPRAKTNLTLLTSRFLPTPMNHRDSVAVTALSLLSLVPSSQASAFLQHTLHPLHCIIPRCCRLRAWSLPTKLKQNQPFTLLFYCQ